MKCINLTLFFLLFLFAKAFSQTNEKCKISFELEDLPDGVVFYLTVNTEKGTLDTVQSIISNSGKFQFMVDLVPNGQMIFIRTKSIAEFQEKNKMRDWIGLILDKSVRKISGSYRNWPENLIDSSEAMSVYNNYHLISKYYIAKNDSLGRLKNKDTLLLNENISDYVKFSIEYFSEHKNSIATPLLILRNPLISLDQKSVNYDMLPLNIKESYFGNKLLREIQVLKLRNQIVIGTKIPDLRIELEDGTQKSIREIAAQSKYTLVDFWAYWCAPCLADIPNMKRTYDSFNSKGFNILSISIDPNLKAWKKSLSKTNTNWINGIDFSQKAKKIFALDAIPGYILLNNSSEIVAIDIFGFKTDSMKSMNVDEVSLRNEKLYSLIGRLLNN